ncbi:MAG: phosphocholine cytidylyltransferase family protein [Cyclobacteriaceae bacterium]
MKAKIETAVILAAGLGSRLGEIKGDKPKAFIKVGDQSLIERSIQLLLSKGIQSVIIGTGYLSEEFDALIGKYPQVKTRKNTDYATTGSMYTLYLIREQIKGPFLLLEGDLLYESAVLDEVMDDPRENIILASDATESGDEVFIETREVGLLNRMSKQKSELKRVAGELVGISKLTSSTLKLMSHFAEASYNANDDSIHYEDAMVGVAQQVELNVKVVNDMAWCEIDDASHLERAVNYVYPKILERS